HHIFPKKVLYDAGYERSQVNALANFTFLSQETNIRISAKHPAEYIPEHEARQPGAVASHWMPMAPELHETERYPDFLQARRELLAEATNQFLDRLWGGSDDEPVLEPEVAP